ncbi:MAG: hypothetical protein ACRELY_00625 [Polyangiaceae bacterium]
MKRSLTFLALALALCGCERGCLSTWWQSHTRQPPPITGSQPDEHPGCVAGFSRCMGGELQASRDAPNVKCTPEGCACPWDAVGKCDHGCVQEGVAFELGADAGALQLCAPERVADVIADGEIVLDAGEIACEMEGYRCADGVVSSCATPKAARCLHGCAKLHDVVLDIDDLRSAALVFCARR